MKYRLRTLLLLTTAAIIAVIGYQRVQKMPVAGEPPLHVLRQLETQFSLITADMNEVQVFETLGLKPYHQYLATRTTTMEVGAGGDWVYYLDTPEGYSLALRYWMGAGPAQCCLRTPANPEWRMTPTNARSQLEKSFSAMLRKKTKQTPIK